MKCVIKILLLHIAIVFMSCSEEAIVDNLGNGELEKVCITGKNFQYDSATRSSVNITESGASFIWGENDTVGIFPNTGSQAEFAMSQGAGTQTATFTGGGWALKSSATYAAYYPYNFYNRDMTKIPVSYVGQTQSGNNNTDHIGAYDFMAASVATPSNGAVAFDMQHLGCLVQLKITIPEPTTLKKVKLLTNGEFAQTGTIDLTQETMAIVSKTASTIFEVVLQNINTTTEDEEVVVYFMMPPTDLSSNTLKVQITTDSDENIEYGLINRNFESGKVYALIASDIPTYHVGTAGALSSMISDEEKYTFKKIKVTGYLNGSDIRFIRDMAGSDEDGFVTDGILESLDISSATIVEGGQYYYDDGDYYYYTKNNIIGDYMFAECPSLVSIKLPQNVSSIENQAFEECKNLTNVIIPNSVEKILYRAFYGCHRLESIKIPSSVTAIHSEAFEYCNRFKEFIVDEQNQYYKAVDGILYNNDITNMIICPYAYVSDNLVIPSTVTSITSFKSRTGLTGKVTIPGSVTKIPNQGFMYSRITEVVMEHGVRSIGDEAFRGTNLSKVTLPETIKGFGSRAFYANSSLSEIHYYGTPFNFSSALDVFYNIAYPCKLYVPKGSKESFVNSSSWSYYFSPTYIIEME